MTRSISLLVIATLIKWSGIKWVSAGLLIAGGGAIAPSTVMATSEPTLAAPVPVSPEDVPIALLVDVSSGQVLHAHNETRRFVPASITKTMTAFVAFELMEKGRISPNTQFTMSSEAFEEWNRQGSTMWLDTETPVSVDDLLTGILTVSANDGSIVFAEGAAGSVPKWIEMMNAEARNLDMINSRFGTPNGWPDDGHTFTTAQDLVKLAKAVITRHPENFARYFGNRTFAWNGVEQGNYDPLIRTVEGADGLKTGFTREAGFGFLGTAKRGDQRLVLVIAGADEKSTRDRLSRDLVEWGFEAFDRQKLYSEDQSVGRVRVQGGAEREVSVVTDRTVYANVPKGQSSQLSATIQYDGPVRAPIKAGQRVGTLEITVPGMEPARVPLLAQDGVGKAGFLDRLSNGFAGWLS